MKKQKENGNAEDKTQIFEIFWAYNEEKAKRESESKPPHKQMADNYQGAMTMDQKTLSAARIGGREGP